VVTGKLPPDRPQKVWFSPLSRYRLAAGSDHVRVDGVSRERSCVSPGGSPLHSVFRNSLTSRLLVAAIGVVVWFGSSAAGLATNLAPAAEEPAAGHADEHPDTDHADEHHGDDHHGDHGHGLEIGHNPPQGVSTSAFESPAWFQADLAIWSFAVFVLLLVLLTKFAWKPIMDGLAKREQGIADTIAATQRANAEAKQMLASYEKRLSEAADEVRSMLEEARRDADATKQTIIGEARKAAGEEQARARREIALATDEALSTIAERAGELAVGVAGKFLKEKLSNEDQARLIRDSVSAIRTSPSVN
jgi:F-type H+-transporting ATPase subunit b